MKLRGTHEGKETISGQCHDIGLENRRFESQHSWIHVKRTECSARDDDRREPFEDWFDGQTCVEAHEMEYWVRDRRVVGLERLEQQSESFMVRRDQSCECSNFLQRRVFVDSGKLQSSNERRQAFSAEPDNCRTSQRSVHVQRDAVVTTRGRGRATDLRGLRSMKVMSLRCCKKESGVSATT